MRWRDPIVEEVRRARDAYAKQFNYDLDAIYRDLKAKERHEPLSVTQGKLAAWCLTHPPPGMRIIVVPEPWTNIVIQDGTQGCLAITWVYAPPHLGIAPTEEVLVTFSGALADRHPSTAPGESEQGVDVEGKAGVRLLTWGDPYLTAWLEAVRGAPLTEADYHAAGPTPATDAI